MRSEGIMVILVGVGVTGVMVGGTVVGISGDSVTG